MIETNLSFLASVGSVSPYVGLFGTVWGIMHAFVGLGALTQVTLATVAPGIAEALVATAIGLLQPSLPWWPATVLPATLIPLPRSRKRRRKSSQHSATQCGRTGHGFGALTMPAVAHRGRGWRTINKSTWFRSLDVMLVLLIIFMA